jgi:signal transduction histidine kinase/FixJ family two-component response regulator
MAKPRILIVEDDAIVVGDIKKALEGAGHGVSCVPATDEEAIRGVREHEPGLILMDVRLRGRMDGLEAARRTSPHVTIPIVYLASHPGDVIPEAAPSTEPCSVLSTPVDDATLESTVVMACHHAETARRLGVRTEQLARCAQELERSKRSFQAIVEQDSDGVLVTTLDGTICYVNTAACHLFNSTQEELVGTVFGVPVTTTGHSVELEILSKGGAVGTGEMRMIVTEWEGNSAYLLSIYDVTEHRRHEEALQEAVATLKKLNAMKSDFISIASHELRTPLTSIKGSIDLLVKGGAGELTGTQERFLRMAERNVNRLNALLNDLLDIGAIEAGRVTLCRGRMDLGGAVQRVMAVLEPLARAKAITLGRVAPDEPWFVHADEHRTEQVLVNLVGNAIKFTPNAGSVVIALHPARPVEGSGKNEMEYVEVVVTDTGCGIPEEVRGHIFEKFIQAEASLDRGQPGTGLGLAISKGIVEAQGGRIWFESGVGLGSSFHFTLPVHDESTIALRVLEDELEALGREGAPLSVVLLRPPDPADTGIGPEPPPFGDLVAALQKRAGSGLLLRSGDRVLVAALDETAVLILPGMDRAATKAVLPRLQQNLLEDLPSERMRLPMIVIAILTYPEDGTTARELLAHTQKAIGAGR